MGISLLLPLVGAYAYYDSLREADFLSPGTKFEQSDLPDLLSDKQGISHLAPLLSSGLVPPEWRRLPPAGLNLLASSPLQDPFPLRC